MNEVRTAILCLPPSGEESPWSQWIPPGFDPGVPSPSESLARSELLGRPVRRKEAEFSATLLTRLAMWLPESRSLLASRFGKLRFSFELDEQGMSGFVPGFAYDPVAAAVAASGAIARAAAESGSEDAARLASSKLMRPDARFAMAACCAAILAVVASSRPDFGGRRAEP